MPTLTERNAQMAREILGVSERPKQSTSELRMQAIRATLTALTEAAKRHDHAAVAAFSHALKALSEAIV